MARRPTRRPLRAHPPPSDRVHDALRPGHQGPLHPESTSPRSIPWPTSGSRANTRTPGRAPDHVSGPALDHPPGGGLRPAEDTNGRYKYLLAHGETGLSTDFDLPTLLGYDSDHPVGRPEVGKIGVAVDTVEDVRAADAGHPARPGLHLVHDQRLRVRADRHVPSRRRRAQGVRGGADHRHDPERHPEGVHGAERVHLSARAAVKLVVDTMEYAATAMPRFNPVSVCGLPHPRRRRRRRSRSSAFTLAAGHCYVDRGASSGGSSRTSWRRGSRSSGHPQRFLRGDLQVPRGPAPVGAH